MATEQEDIEFYKKEISNYEKKIKEKKIICIYLLKKYLELKGEKANENIVSYFNTEFHRLLSELKHLENMVKFFQDHIKIFY